MNARQRREIEYAASANRQAELKQEAADRRAERAARNAGESQPGAGTADEKPGERPANPS